MKLDNLNLDLISLAERVVKVEKHNNDNDIYFHRRMTELEELNREIFSLIGKLEEELHNIDLILHDKVKENNKLLMQQVETFCESVIDSLDTIVKAKHSDLVLKEKKK